MFCCASAIFVETVLMLSSQEVLHAGGVWSEVEMKDRVRVNAARVGLVMQESSKEAVS